MSMTPSPDGRRPDLHEAGDPYPASGEAAPASSPSHADRNSAEGAPRRRRRRGGRGRGRSTASLLTPEERSALAAAARGGDDDDAASESRERYDHESAGEAPAAADEPRAERAAGTRSRRRRGRGGAKAAGESAATEPATKAPPAEASASGGTRKKRRRGSRGGRGREDEPREKPRRVAVDVIPGEEDELAELPLDTLPLDDEAEAAASDGAKRKRKRRRRKSGENGNDDGAAAPPPRRSRAGSEDDDEFDEDAPEPEVERTSLILVNSHDAGEQRVAVVRNERLVDFDMTVETKVSHVGDIYRGRVVNLEPAIGAAFIDFGRGRNGFLHTSDVLSAYGDKDWKLQNLLTTRIDPDEWRGEDTDGVADSRENGRGSAAEGAPEGEPRGENGAAADGGVDEKRPRKTRGFRARPRLPITELLKKGQQVCVQVTKDAIGDKGPTLTTYLSIPGRYLVLMPSMERRGVSRKIEDDKERRRLKRIVEGLKAPDGMGVIVRTAGVGRTKSELKRDLDYLLGLWENFGKKLRHGSGTAPLYVESDVAIRTLRDLYSNDTEAVIVDDKHVHGSLIEFAEELMPDAVERIRLHEGPRPLFHTYNVEQDFDRVFSRRVDLPSGGSIVIDQAEALVAIDVNSGRTRTDGFDFEAIALKTNLEAVPEIARQIRLRDLGGILVLDFIDMIKRSNMQKVERAFRAEMAKDRARSKIGRISQFGLLEMTRQRLGPGLDKKVFTPCPRCRGTARVRTVESRAAAILRRLGAALTLKGFTEVEVRAHPEVVEHLQKHCQSVIKELEVRFARQISFKGVAEQAEDSVLRYLRADGREVRPGGRRKR